MELLDLARASAKAAESKKASRLLLQDLQGLSDICDIQMICSGSNQKQVQAICESIEEAVRKQFNVRPFAVEGKLTGQWVVMDFGGMIVHIFDSTIRDFYALDQIWPKAKIIDF